MMTIAIFFINLAQIGILATALSLFTLHCLQLFLWDYRDNEIVKIFELVKAMGVFLIIFSISLFFVVFLFT
ncbi:hypothetical protein PCC7424_4764 [Gloeothece citriformis PCC 7424]|uniref:Uncharacterized protein n=1 Tax=Gloeothece citriformis (strain PCC 7424) TaxID=65393 RepID=B7KD02_GLOC7|nr:hypothetical protein PCC7424_4764 [Gloeothece citriformis PCC 7424]